MNKLNKNLNNIIKEYLLPLKSNTNLLNYNFKTLVNINSEVGFIKIKPSKLIKYQRDIIWDYCINCDEITHMYLENEEIHFTWSGYRHRTNKLSISEMTDLLNGKIMCRECYDLFIFKERLIKNHLYLFR